MSSPAMPSVWRPAHQRPAFLRPRFRPTPLFALLAACLLAFTGCLPLHPPKVDLASAVTLDLARLNEDLRTPEFERPKGTAIVKGRVVGRYQGRRYGLVLALAPEAEAPPSSEAPGRGVILCLFEAPQPLTLASPGDLVAVAGFLDRVSVPDNLILTRAELVGR